MSIQIQANGIEEERPFYESATTEEWVKAFNEGVDSHDKDTLGLTLEDVSWESSYED